MAGSRRRELGSAGTADWIEHVHEALFYVPSVARRFVGRSLTLDELVAAGNLGLVEAALRFDRSRSVKFVTYADWWIRKTILDALERQSGALRLPSYQHGRLRTVLRARASLTAQAGREPDPQQIAEASEMSPDEVQRLLQVTREPVSLEQPLRPGDDRPLKEYLQDTSAAHPHGLLVRQAMSSSLQRGLSTLDPREREAITLRFGLQSDRPLTLREAGRAMGLSRERVRQLEGRALIRLRQALNPAPGPARPTRPTDH